MSSQARVAAVLCSLLFGSVACVVPPPNDGTVKKKGEPQATSTCGTLTQRGVCEIRGTTPSIAMRCSADGQKLLSDDCSAHGLVCAMDAQKGATCVTASEAPTSTGTTGSPNTSCGNITEKGICSGTSVMKWCLNNKLITSDCAYDAGMTCKMVNGEAKCVDSSGSTGSTSHTSVPCGSTPATGVCDGTKMYWCSNGEKLDSDCAYDAGSTCQMVNGEAKCVNPSMSSSGCGDVPALGVCDGSTMKWCMNDKVETSDCSWDPGLTCQMVSGEAKCVPLGGSCGSVTAQGTCDGSTIQRCVSDQIETTDCSVDPGNTCKIVDGSAQCVPW